MNQHLTTPDERWRIQKAKLKVMYRHLEDDDLTFDYGKKEVMRNSLQAKLGKTREELDELLAQLGHF